jgi:hypothetical protein
LTRIWIWILASTLACAVLSHSRHASGQAVDPDVDARAREAFEDGQRAFGAGDYASALLHFKRSFELVHHDAVRFNIATSLRRLGRFREAHAEYAIVAESPVVDEATGARARAAMVEVRAQLATLIVEGPSGADVFVDAERVCSPPCRLELDPRPHSVLLRAKGREETRRVELSGGKTTSVVFRLDRPATPSEPRPRAAPPAKRSVEREPASMTPGALTWVGGGLVVLGAAGTTYFGLRVRSLREEHDDNPTFETQADGNQARDLTNVSLGVAALGAVLIAVDLLILSGGDTSSSAVFDGRWRF